MAEDKGTPGLEAPLPQPKIERRGRKTKLTPVLLDEICLVLENTSTPLKDVVIAAGVDESTFFRWLEKGKIAKSGIYRVFRERVGEAKAKGTKVALAQLRKLGIAKEDWRAIAWELERTRPKEFSPRLKLHIESEMVEAIERLKRGYADDPLGLEKALRILAGEFGGGGGGEDPISEGGADPGGGEALHPTLPEPSPTGVPGA